MHDIHFSNMKEKRDYEAHLQRLSAITSTNNYGIEILVALDASKCSIYISYLYKQRSIYISSAVKTFLSRTLPLLM